MPNNMAIKRWMLKALKFFHYLLTVLLLLIVFAWSFIPILLYLFPMEEKVYFKKEIMKGLWLYEIVLVTNQTAADTYSFYLGSEIEGNPIPILEKEAPFLRGTTKEADISLIETGTNGQSPRIMVKYCGKILEFHNVTYAPHGVSLISLDAPYPLKSYRYP